MLNIQYSSTNQTIFTEFWHFPPFYPIFAVLQINPYKNHTLMSNLFYLVPALGVLGLLYTFVKYNWVYKQDAGSDRMQEISKYIAEGAMAFLKANIQCSQFNIQCSTFRSATYLCSFKKWG